MKKVSRNEIERKISDIRERMSDRGHGSGADPDTGGAVPERSGADEAREAMIGRRVSGCESSNSAKEAREAMIGRRVSGLGSSSSASEAREKMLDRRLTI